MIADIKIKPCNLRDDLEVAIFDAEGKTIVAGKIGYCEFVDTLTKGLYAPFDITRLGEEEVE